MAIPFLSDISGKSATFAGDVTISKSTPVLKFDNLAGGGLDPSLTATGTDFTISTASITPISLSLSTGDLTLSGSNDTYVLKLDTNNNAMADVAKVVFNDRGAVGWNGSAVFLSDHGSNKDLVLKVGVGNLYFKTNNSTRVTIADTTGNATFTGNIALGGGTLKTYHSNVTSVIALDDNGSIFTRADETYIGHNIYYDSGDEGTAIEAGYSTLLRLTEGEFYIYGTAASVSADATTSIQERFKIDTSGNATFSGNVNLNSDTGPIITLTDTDPSIGVDSIIGHIAFVGTEIGGETSRIASVSETTGGEAGLRFYTGSSVTQALKLDKDQNATFAGDITLKNNATLSSIGNVTIDIDSDNDATDRQFRVTQHGAGNTLFFVNETSSQFSHSLAISGGALSITGDGSNAVTLTESGGGDFTIDAAGDITLDAAGNDIRFFKAGVEYGKFKSDSSDFAIYSSVENKDMIFRGNDGGTTIDALTLDMSEGGNATFRGTITLGVADSSSGHINAYENMTFNIDTDNDDTNRYFAWYTNGSDGSGTELLKILETGDASFAGTVEIPGYITHTGDPDTKIGFNVDDTIELRCGGNLQINADASRAYLRYQGDAKLYTDNTGINFFGHAYPNADSTYDLGKSNLYWANAYIDAITTTGAVSVGGLLTHARTQGTVTESALSGTATASMLLTTNYTYTGTNSSGTYARQDYLNLAGTGGSFQNVAGYQMKTNVTSTGTSTAIKNIMSRVHTASAGDINQVANFVTHNEFSGTGNVGTWAGLAIADIGAGFENTQTITNTYGIKIGDITHGTQTNAPYAIHTGTERSLFGYITLDNVSNHGRIHSTTSSLFLGGVSNSLVQLSANLIPDGDSARDLGATNRYWRNAFIDSITTTGAVGIKTAAAYTANTSADELVIGDGTGDHGITIHTGTTNQGSIYFADDLDAEGSGDNPVGNRDGVFRYSQNDNHFQFRTSGNQLAATIKHNGSTFESNITGKGYLNLSNGYGSANGIYLYGNPAMWREDADNLRFPLDVARFNEIATVGNQNSNNNSSGAPGRYATGILDLSSGSNMTAGNNFRIETNIPFNSEAADFTVIIEGFRYGDRKPVHLTICWHIYPANTPYNHCVISHGGWSPVIKMARNTTTNNVTLLLETPGYWPKMYVKSLHSSNYEVGAYAKGWTWANGTLASGYDIITTIPYQALSLGDGGIVNGGAITATSFTGDGSNLTNLPAQAAPSNMVTTDTNQNISGAKTFTSVSNQFNGHLYYSAYDSQGQHYPHYRDGSANNGADINWRHYYGSNYKTHQWTSDSSGNMAQIFQGRIEAVGELKGTSLDINGAADISGNLTVGGDLNITGDINSTSVTNLDVDDKTITVAKGAADSAAADGAGIVVDGASASLLYDHTGTQWEFNKPVEVKVGSSAITFTEYSNGATIWLDGADGDFIGGDYFNISAYGTTQLAFGYGAASKMTMSNGGALHIESSFTVQDALAAYYSTATSATTTTTIASVNKSTYGAAFFDYVVYKSTNIRAGTITACNDGTNVSFAETSTTDLGDTSDVTFAVDIDGTQMRLRATTTSSTWTIKTIVRAI